MDVTELHDFYDRPLGCVVRRLLAHRLTARWRNVNGCKIIGIGYATPYLDAFAAQAACVAAFMPAAQGVAARTASAPAPLHALVQIGQLPLADASVDLLLVVHCLEMAESARPFLREVWRVLKPEGRLIVIVPNRASIWARFDTTPFGNGSPYSRGQIERLLRQALFTPLAWSNALHVPPWERRFLLRGAVAWERVGAMLAPGFGGVIIVEAQKELMAPISGGSRLRTGIPKPALIGRPNSKTSA